MTDFAIECISFKYVLFHESFSLVAKVWGKRQNAIVYNLEELFNTEIRFRRTNTVFSQNTGDDRLTPSVTGEVIACLCMISGLKQQDCYRTSFNTSAYFTDGVILYKYCN